MDHNTMLAIWTLLRQVLGVLGGASVILIGTSRWFGNLVLGRVLESDRARYAMQLEELRSRYAHELESYKTRLEHSIVVSRAQFQTEFDAMKQVFQKLSQVRLRMGSLRPLFDIAEGGTTQEERKQKRFERLQEELTSFVIAYNELLAVVEDLSPFYPTEIYQQLNECLSAANAEQIDIRLEGRDALSHDGFERGRINSDRFTAAYNKVSELIRDRISRLAIAPSTE
jgi:hypothetical protein